MNLCESHFGSLSDAIKLRGLWDLVIKNDEDAKPMVAALNADEGSDPDCITDPLLAAQYLLFKHAIEVGGMYLLLPTQDGKSLCPLCEYVHNVADADWMNWINGVCDQVYQEAMDQHMIAPETRQ